MPKDLINGVELYWEMSGGSGEPLVCVHGGFIDHNHWRFLIPYFEDSFRVLTYDRRGHSLSERPPEPATLSDHVADLGALLEYVDLGPAHVIGNSYGGLVVLRLAAERPELIRSVMVHEAPVYDLDVETAANEYVTGCVREIDAVARALESGQREAGARMFVDYLFGEEAWNELLEDTRQLLIANASSFIEEANDLQPFTVDLFRLGSLERPILLTQGEISHPAFRFMMDQLERGLPQAQAVQMQGVGHSPHVSHAEEYAAIISSFIAGGA